MIMGEFACFAASRHALTMGDIVQFTAGMAYPLARAWSRTFLYSSPVTTPFLSSVPCGLENTKYARVMIRSVTFRGGTGSGARVAASSRREKTNAARKNQRCAKCEKLEPRQFLGSRPPRFRRVARPPDRVSDPRACHASGARCRPGRPRRTRARLRGVGARPGSRRARDQRATRAARGDRAPRETDKLVVRSQARSDIAETRGRFLRRVSGRFAVAARRVGD